MRVVLITCVGLVVGSGTLVLATTTSIRPHQERKTDMTEPIPGLKKVPSPHNAAKTVERFEAILKEKGMHRFARIDHNKGAAKVKVELRPNILLIFGKPEIGTPLMQR